MKHEGMPAQRIFLAILQSSHTIFEVCTSEAEHRKASATIEFYAFDADEFAFFGFPPAFLSILYL